VNGWKNCPDAATLAAFLDGMLDRVAAQDVATHLAGCDSCLTETHEVLPFVRAESGTEAPDKLQKRRWSGAIAAAVLLAFAIGALTLFRGRIEEARYHAAVRPLLTAAASADRTLEPRLSGFPWTRRQPPVRRIDPSEPATVRLEGAAGEVLEKTADGSSTKDRHATGVARLFAGDPADAVGVLRAAAGKNPSNATLWNDLAAALLARAAQTQSPADLAQALAAADHALAHEPRLPEALFNRALILEKMGRRNDAIAAWEQSIAADSTSGWSGEARTHLSALRNGGQ
jgi:tetratricopeptide (TPR) repeat protein